MNTTITRPEPTSTESAPLDPPAAAPGPRERLQGKMHIRYHPCHPDVFVRLSGDAAWFLFERLGRDSSRSDLKVGAHLSARLKVVRSVLVELRLVGGALAGPAPAHASTFLWQKNVGAWTLMPDGEIRILGPAGAILSSLVRTGQAREAKKGQEVVFRIDDYASGRVTLVSPQPDPPASA